MPNTPRRLATIKDAAAHVQVHPATIRRWIQQGVLPAYRLGPRALRVDLNELEGAALHQVPTAGHGRR